MKRRNLLFLVGLALALVGAAVFDKLMRDCAGPPDMPGQLVLPNLHVNDITKITVCTSGSQKTVVRIGERWVCQDRFNYPADFMKIRELLTSLAKLKIGKVLNLDDKQRAVLKLVPPDPSRNNDQGITGILVKLYRKDNSEASSLLIGDVFLNPSRNDKQPFGTYPDGRYVSPDMGTRGFLVGNVLQLVCDDSEDWLERNLFSVHFSDVKNVTISGSNRKTVVLRRRTRKSDLEVDGLAEDQKSSVDRVRSVASALTYLRFVDLADPSLTNEKLGLNGGTSFVVTTWKNEVYSIIVGQPLTDTDERYIRIRVNMVPGVDVAATNAKVRALDRKVGAWSFKMTSDQVAPMIYRRCDLVSSKAD